MRSRLRPSSSHVLLLCLRLALVRRPGERSEELELSNDVLYQRLAETAAMTKALGQKK